MFLIIISIVRFIYRQLTTFSMVFIGQQFARIWFADSDDAVVHTCLWDQVSFLLRLCWLYDQYWYTYDIVPNRYVGGDQLFIQIGCHSYKCVCGSYSDFC